MIAIVLAIFGVFGYFKYTEQSEAPATTATTTQSPTGVWESVKGAVSSVANTASPTQKSEIPPRTLPVNGKLQGVVEVGASGFNYFVVNTDAQGNYTVVAKDFGVSLVKEGLATLDDIKTGLKQYLSNMANLGVSGKDLHFVVSSGAAKDDKAQTIVAALKEKGYVVNVVTPEEEGIYAYNSAMNPAFADKGFVVDIGSTNTKIAWKQGKGIRASETTGAKYYEDKTPDAAVFQTVKLKASQVPADKRQICFIIGGAPNDLVKKFGTGGTGRYLWLNPLNSYDPGKNVKVASGLNIIKAIQEATGVTEFVFDDDANFTIGFLTSLYR